MMAVQTNLDARDLPDNLKGAGLETGFLELHRNVPVWTRQFPENSYVAHRDRHSILRWLQIHNLALNLRELHDLTILLERLQLVRIAVIDLRAGRAG